MFHHIFLIIYRQGAIDPVGERIYTLEQSEIAFRELAAGGHKVRLVLKRLLTRWKRVSFIFLLIVTRWRKVPRPTCFRRLGSFQKQVGQGTRLDKMAQGVLIEICDELTK